MNQSEVGITAMESSVQAGMASRLMDSSKETNHGMYSLFQKPIFLGGKRKIFTFWSNIEQSGLQENIMIRL